MKEFLLLLCLALSANALPIDSTKNHIEFPRGNIAFASFFHKMDSLVYTGKGQVNILQLGGSHIQADVISNRVRTRLAKEYPGRAGSRGFVFPFNAAKTNTPQSYSSKAFGHFKAEKSVFKNNTTPLGLMGIAITTGDPDAKVKIVLDANSPIKIWNFNKVRVFGFSKDFSITPALSLDSTTFISSKADKASESFLFNLPKRSDSLTLSFVWNDKNKENAFQSKLSSLDSLQKDSLFADSNFFKNHSSFTLTGILLTDTASGISYNAIGINGANVAAYLSLKNLERDLSFLKPDLIILSIGINDANVSEFDEDLFKSHYDTLITRLKSVTPDVPLIFTTNNDSYLTIKGKKSSFPNSNGILAREAFFSLAKKYKAGIWDLYSIMGGYRSIEKWEAEDFARKDKVHFKNNGYEVLGDLFYQALIESFKPENDTKGKK